MACRRIWTQNSTNTERGSFLGTEGVFLSWNTEVENQKIPTNVFNTHRHILIFTQIELSIDGRVRHFWEAAEELWDKLSCQALLLRAALHSVQDDLVGMFILQDKTRHRFLLSSEALRGSHRLRVRGSLRPLGDPQRPLCG